MKRKEIIKITIQFFLCMIVVIAPAADEPPAKKQKTQPLKEIFIQASIPQIIKGKTSDGNPLVYRLHMLPKDCIFKSAFFKGVVEDPAVKTKIFEFPVTRSQLNAFEEFCQQGGGIRAFRRVWGKNPEKGYNILKKLGYDVLQNHNLPLSSFTFTFLQSGKKVAITGPLLYKMLLNVQNHPAFTDLLAEYSDTQTADFDIDESIVFKRIKDSKLVEDPEKYFPLLLEIATLPAKNLIQETVSLLKRNFQSKNYKYDDVIDIMDVLIEGAENFLSAGDQEADNTLRRLLYWIKIGIEWLETFDVADNKKLFNEIWEAIYIPRNEDGEKPYEYLLDSHVIRLYAAAQFAYLVPHKTFIDSFNDIITSISPSKECTLCDDVDQQMVFVHLLLLLKFFKFGYQAWSALYLPEFALYLVNWSRDLAKKHSGHSRTYFERQIFDNFIEDLQNLGLNEEEESNLKSNLYLSAERDIDVRQIARQIRPLTQQQEQYRVPIEQFPEPQSKSRRE
jgi:hypothetical protein